MIFAHQIQNAFPESLQSDKFISKLKDTEPIFPLEDFTDNRQHGQDTETSERVYKCETFPE